MSASLRNCAERAQARGVVIFPGRGGLIFGVQPAREAAALHPIEALRG